MNIYGTDYTDQATAKFAQMRDQQDRRDQQASQQVQPQFQQVGPPAGWVEGMQHQNFENNLHAAEMAGAIYVGTKLIGAHQASRQASQGTTVRAHKTINWGFVLGLVIVFVVLYAMAH